MNHYATRVAAAVAAPGGMRLRARRVARNGAISLLSCLRRPPPGPSLRCLYCHYVFDDQTDAFERLLVALKQEGVFVTTDTCLRMARGELPIDGRYFHLSFDDGFRNLFTNAVPILIRQQVPSLFFVPSGFVDADYETARQYCLETTGYAGVIEMMRWRDLQEMLAAGFEIGSHTRTHARFSEISADPKRLHEELQGSKDDLEQHLGVTCKTISWPYGRIADADTVALDAVRQCGYQACFGAYRGTISTAQTNLYAIPRHHFEVQWPINHVLFFSRGSCERAEVPT